MNTENTGDHPEKLERENSNLNWLLNNWNIRVCESLTFPNNRIRDKILNKIRKFIGEESSRYLDPQLSKQSHINLRTIAQLIENNQRILSLDSDIKLLIAQSIIQNMEYEAILDIQKTELKVFSQWGEDGIIQWLIHKIPIENPVFIEFGVENYLEANTRFLLLNNYWKGLVIDSSDENIHQITSSELYWKYDLQTASHFITRENINEIFVEAGITGDIGLLSIDVDGNDYWIWEAITVISPRIVICEYNSVFGGLPAITIPYDPNFQRTKAHYSNLYYGASIQALCVLARKKGYIFVGSNKAGNNAFFVRSDVSSGFQSLSPEEGYVLSQFRESRDKEGNLSYLSGRQRLEIISDLPVVNVMDNSIHSLSEFMDHD